MRYRWTLLDAGRLMLDAGSMFGLVPRAVWKKAVEVDEHDRITLRHNCVLLESETDDPDLGRQRRVLLETGTGDKLDAKMSAIFGLDGRTVEHAVRDAGVEPDAIDDVIVSHLHFDHAGGLTRACREGETPDWVAEPGTAPLATDRVKVTFPNAHVHVQAREWRDAMDDASVMTRTYFRDHLDPIADKIVLAESGLAFTPGLRPGRTELPRGSVAHRTTEVLPGVGVFGVPGHTWGQQATIFEDTDGRSVVFAADLLPSVHHLGAAYSLAYDVEPYTSMVTKRWFLGEAADRDWLLILDHEPRSPLQRVRRSDRGWFELETEG